MALTRIFLLCICPLFSLAQLADTSRHINKKKLKTYSISASALYAGTLTGLSILWYKDSHRQSFRFFNDNAEWMQVDKIGHFYSAFYFSYGASSLMQQCNVPVKKADLIGTLAGFAVLAPIEILDGFSDAYGASVGDLVADAAGASLYLLEKRLWNEIRIYPKFSFHRTSYASVRPDLLGNGLPGEALKDYNGQTYWFSIDMDKFIRFPKWLNVAVGYGANDMVYARRSQNIAAGYHPFRQYYFALDLDLTSIKTRSKFVKTLIFIGNMIKIPAPTITFSRKGTRLHALYF